MAGRLIACKNFLVKTACSEAVAYLLLGKDGKERYFLDKAVRKIVEHYIPASERALNVKRYGKGELRPSFAPLVEALKTPSMLSAKRVMVLDVEERFAKFSTEDLEKECLRSANSGVVVFLWPKPDKRQRLYKVLEKVALCVDCKPVPKKELETWVQSLAKARGASMRPTAVSLLVERAGENMLELFQELEKVCLYTDKRSISPDDVEATLSTERSVQWFALSDALGRRDQARAFRVIKELLDKGEPHVRLLAQLSGHFRNLLCVKALLERGMREHDIIGVLKMHPYRVKILCEQAEGYRLLRLERAVERCASADREMKTSFLPPQLILDKLVVTIASRHAYS